MVLLKKKRGKGGNLCERTAFDDSFVFILIASSLCCNDIDERVS